MLDESTGLPELPADYYWKIDKIEIEKKCMGLTWSTLPTLQLQIWGPYGLEMTKEMTDRARNRDEEHADILRENGFQSINDGYFNTHFNRIYEWVRTIPATAENIYKLATPMAESLGERIETKRKEREDREKLDATLDQFVGIYPPNNLKETV